jgi:hypothetical protein
LAGKFERQFFVFRKRKMDIRDAPLLCEREEKIRCVLDFIEDTSDRCPILLILIGSGGDGKSMATNEAIEQFHHLHEPGIAADDQRLGFRFLDSPPFRNNVRADGLFDVCTTISHGKMFRPVGISNRHFTSK